MKKTNNFKIKYKLKIKWQLILVLFLIINGCSDFLEVDLPSSQLNTAFVFENKATANAAMVDVYAKVRDKGLISGNSMGLSASMGAYTDELDYFGTSSSSLNFFSLNTVLPTTGVIETWWNNSYNQIYAVNDIYQGVDNSNSLTEIEKNNLKGEALFIRALMHFYLVNVFGDIPYITSTDYQLNQTVSRLNKSEVYDHLINDLKMAKSLLSKNYSGGTRVRPNKSVASALLSRVYLYRENWEEAADEASLILNQTDIYSFPDNISKTFLIQSPSTIWQLLPQSNGRNTLEGNTFIFLSGPPSSTALSEYLLNAFEEGDLRKTNWIKEVTNANRTWHHAFKYKQRTITPSSLEHSIVFRLSEQYLIRAEAKAHQGELTSALEDVNVVRSIAGLAPTVLNSQELILEAVFQERRVEFFTEFGHRFFDLKRTNQLDANLASIKPGWSTHMKNLPLPEREFLLNTNLLPQNEGY